MGESAMPNLSDEVATLSFRGTPAFAAPEVVRQERYGRAADVYSYGVVLCQMTTRRAPYSMQGAMTGGPIGLTSRLQASARFSTALAPS